VGNIERSIIRCSGGLDQGIQTEEEGSVQLTSLYWLIWFRHFVSAISILLFNKTSYLTKEINCNLGFPLQRVFHG